MPRRVLITLDAVGGVWRYALDLAAGLAARDTRCLLVGFGPEPDAAQSAECVGQEVVWTGEPVDWTVTDATALRPGTRRIAELAAAWDADVLHLNLPSQAVGLSTDRPVVVASHSCVPTWWRAVQGTPLPDDWAWHKAVNAQGLRRADAIVVPSESHGAALRAVYGDLPRLHVVHNAVSVQHSGGIREPSILAVGRWWDAGKNGAVLDAATSPWPIVAAGPLAGPNGQQAVFRNARAIGNLPHRDILTLMRRTAVFAAPSRYEPFGLAVVEAAASGAALVLSDIPTFRELWDGAALFVDADDAAGWSRAFATLAADAALRGRLANEAGTRACAFSLPRQAARLSELYASILEPVA